MANLKADLLSKLNGQKYYAEMELLRLSQDISTNYKKKIKLISNELTSIALIDGKIRLTESYFTTPEQIPQEQVPQELPNENNDSQAPVENDQLPEQPVAKHPGQSHGE